MRTSNATYGTHPAPANGPLPMPGTRRQGRNGHFVTDAENWDLINIGNRGVTPGREEALRRCKTEPRALLHLGAFKCDKGVVLAAVERDPEALRWADPSLRADRECVLAAVAAHPSSLRYAGPLRENVDIAVAAVRASGASPLFRIADWPGRRSRATASRSSTRARERATTRSSRSARSARRRPRSRLRPSGSVRTPRSSRACRRRSRRVSASSGARTTFPNSFRRPGAGAPPSS